MTALFRDRMRKISRHPIVRNVLALGSVQVATVVVPLITLPYLARVLDQSQLGIVVFVQAFSFIVALLVEYGFNLSATREIARARDEPGELARTVQDIMGAKLFLSVLACVLSLPLWPLVPIFSSSPGLLLLGVLLGITQGLVPVWFFLGIERSTLIALVELSTRLASLALIVLFVKEAKDADLVLEIYLLAATASSAILITLMYRLVPSVRVTRGGAIRALRQGRTLFAGTGAVALYTGANAFVLGLIVPTSQVAVFASAEKVVRAGNRVLGFAAQAVYPRVSVLLARGAVTRANRLSFLSIGAFGGAAAGGAVLLIVFAEPLIELVFGPRFDEAADLLRILALLLPLNVIGVAVSTQWLLPRGLDRVVTRVVLSAAVLNVVALVLATELLGLKASAWACVAVELFVTTGNVVGARSAHAAEDRFTPAGSPPTIVQDSPRVGE